MIISWNADGVLGTGFSDRQLDIIRITCLFAIGNVFIWGVIHAAVGTLVLVNLVHRLDGLASL